MRWQAPEDSDQRMIRLPRGVLILGGALLLIHAVLSNSSPALWSTLYLNFGLFAERFTGQLPFGLWHGVGTLFSYNFLHGSWEHVGMNVLWLLAFGAPIAKRMGSARFFWLFLLAGCVGGSVEMAVEIFGQEADHVLVPVVGASAGVAGLLGGACRYAFSAAHRQTPWPARRPLLSLKETLRQPAALAIIGVWVGVNILAAFLGPSGLMSPDGMPVHIAWVAHLGGFAGGFFLILLVDRPPLSRSGGVGRVDYGAWR